MTQLELIRSALAKLGPARVARMKRASFDAASQGNFQKCALAWAWGEPGELARTCGTSHRVDRVAQVLDLCIDEVRAIVYAYDDAVWVGYGHLRPATFRSEIESYLAANHAQAVDALLAECADCAPNAAPTEAP